MTAQNSGPVRKKAKPRGKPFPKGQSGNPGGRPKEEREVVEALRLKGMELVEKLLELALGDGNVKAIGIALDRAYGKAKETVELTGKDGGPVEMDATQLTREERDAIRKIRQRLGLDVPSAKD